MASKLRVALIGLGGRGRLDHLNYLLKYQKDVDIVVVCDLFEDRVQDAQKMIKEARGLDALGFTDYKEALAVEGLDASIIATSWRDHIPVAIESMKRGIRPGVEVAGAYSIDQLWTLVHTSEETGVPCMLLENCCYGREELMLLNMIKKGVFGDVIHCEGAYHHDLRGEITEGRERRHYRLKEYTHRNCENYPTHELGPICQMLDINHGNRMMQLNSVASCAKSLNAYLNEPGVKNADLKDHQFLQGDVVTTVIKCARGETIVLRLDTNTPHNYSRGLRIQGTKACYTEDNQTLFIDGVNSDKEPVWKQEWNNIEKFRDQYEHPIWSEFQKCDITAGHGGMDHLVFEAFFDSVRRQVDPPIDVYDMAAWMSISVLSEQSIQMGGAPVAIPDFTNGRWENEMFEIK